MSIVINKSTIQKFDIAGPRYTSYPTAPVWSNEVNERVYIQKLKDGWLDCDVIVATPDMMGQIGPLGRILGPRGLMPTPKAGTVTMDVEKAINEIKAGKIEYRTDKTGNLHVPVGKVSFSSDQLSENMGAFMDSVVRAKPSASKGTYIKSITVSSTMGPGINVETAAYR